MAKDQLRLERVQNKFLPHSFSKFNIVGANRGAWVGLAHPIFERNVIPEYLSYIIYRK